jgi:hypothetical protein
MDDRHPLVGIAQMGQQLKAGLQAQLHPKLGKRFQQLINGQWFLPTQLPTQFYWENPIDSGSKADNEEVHDSVTQNCSEKCHPSTLPRSTGWN